MTMQSLNLNGPKRLSTETIPTFEKLLKHIDTLSLNEEIKAKLIDKARRMPPGSYRHFAKNINHHINTIVQNGNNPT